VQTYQINIAMGRENVHEIRAELFNFPEVLDVFVTGRPESLVVVFWGRPRPGEWLRALRAVGYEVLARRHPGALSAAVDRLGRVPPEEESVWPPVTTAPWQTDRWQLTMVGKPNEHYYAP